MNKYESSNPNFITTAFELLRRHTSSKPEEHITYVNVVSHGRYLKDIIMIVRGIKYQVRMEQGYYNPCSFMYQISIAE